VCNVEGSDFIKYEEDIYFFIQISHNFFHVYQEHLEYADNKNALMTILFGSFGRVLIDDFKSLGASKLKKIFEFIEKKIDSDDEYIATIISTGLVESIVINSENKSKELFLDILKLCHKNTYSYIKEWSLFHGINIENGIK
jgi:hypothetical protein